MKIIKLFLIAYFLCLPLFICACQQNVQTIERPEKIVSLLKVVYDIETYAKLAKLWKEYYDEFPSEDAYANWMYAAKYADLFEYQSLLEDGLKKYPANPTLLYPSCIAVCCRLSIQVLSLCPDPPATISFNVAGRFLFV